ncbi:MAG: hypothetical protein ABIH72_04060 [archaeon]
MTLLRQIEPILKIESLERILNYLPLERGHTSVILSLEGNFDYSSLYKQVQEINPAISLDAIKGINGFFLDMSRIDHSIEKILEIYQKNIRINDKGGITSSDSKAVAINKIVFLDFRDKYLDINVTLKPQEVSLSYDSKRKRFPSYIPIIREEAKKCGIKLREEKIDYHNG